MSKYLYLPIKHPKKGINSSKLVTHDDKMYPDVTNIPPTQQSRRHPYFRANGEIKGPAKKLHILHRGHVKKQQEEHKFI